MRFSTLGTPAAIAAAIAIGCSDPVSPIPQPVPAGANDPAWANVGKTCTVASPVVLLSGERADSLPPVSAFQTIDDKTAAAARVVPGGFGGVFIRNGVLTFYLVDTTQHAAAASALATSGLAPSLNWGTTNVLPGRWDFAQMYDWYRYLNTQVWNIPGVVYSDIDEGQNRIHYGVVDAQARATVEALLERLDVPCYLVAIEESGEIGLTRTGSSGA